MLTSELPPELEEELHEKLRDEHNIFWKEAKGPYGTRCPHCYKHVQIYKTRLNSTLIRQLRMIARQTQHGAWINPLNQGLEEKKLAASYRKLLWWDLIEQNKEKTKLYRATRKGIAFLKNELAVPNFALEYGGGAIAIGGELIYCRQISPGKFNLTALLEEDSNDPT